MDHIKDTHCVHLIKREERSVLQKGYRLRLSSYSQKNACIQFLGEKGRKKNTRIIDDDRDGFLRKFG